MSSDLSSRLPAGGKPVLNNQRQAQVIGEQIVRLATAGRRATLVSLIINNRLALPIATPRSHPDASTAVAQRPCGRSPGLTSNKFAGR